MAVNLLQLAMPAADGGQAGTDFDLRRKLAEAMIKESLSQKGPLKIEHPMQGVAHMADQLTSALMMRNLMRDQGKAREEGASAQTALLQALMGGNKGSVAGTPGMPAPQPTPSVPSSTPDFTPPNMGQMGTAVPDVMPDPGPTTGAPKVGAAVAQPEPQLIEPPLNIPGDIKADLAKALTGEFAPMPERDRAPMLPNPHSNFGAAGKFMPPAGVAPDPERAALAQSMSGMSGMSGMSPPRPNLAGRSMVAGHPGMPQGPMPQQAPPPGPVMPPDSAMAIQPPDNGATIRSIAPTAPTAPMPNMAAGTPYAPVNGPQLPIARDTVPPSRIPPGGVDRSQFSSVMSDPRARAILLANVHAEVGDQFEKNPEVAQAKLETIFNRAASRGVSPVEAATDPKYYPGVTLRRMQAVNPDVLQRYAGIYDKVAGGSNVSQYATGNASGTVGFAGGPQTFQAPGTYERFGIEGADKKWATTVRVADASGKAGLMALGGAKPQDMPPMTAPPAPDGIAQRSVRTMPITRQPQGQMGEQMPTAQPQQAQPQAQPQPQAVAPAMSEQEVQGLRRMLASPDPSTRNAGQQMLQLFMKRSMPPTQAEALDLEMKRAQLDQLRAKPQAQIKEIGGRALVIDPRDPSKAQWLAPPNTGGMSPEGQKAYDKEIGETQAKAVTSLPSVLDTSQRALDTIEKIRTHPGRSTGTGIAGMVLPHVPGTDARGFSNLVDQAVGQTFLEAFNSLRGGGQITEAEGRKATQAMARLDRAQSERDFNEGLADLQSVIQLGMQRAKNMAGGKYQQTAPAQSAPAGGDGAPKLPPGWGIRRLN